MAKSAKWTRWFFSDWLKDAGVRSVSCKARGLWIDMLALMDESPRRGFLQQASGKVVSLEQLANICGCSTDDTSRLVQELDDAGVCSSNEDGIRYSRRMVRDMTGRDEAAVRQRKCRHGPVTKMSQKGGSKGVHSSNEDLYFNYREDLPFKSDEFFESFRNWLLHKSERSDKPYRPRGRAGLLTKLRKLGEHRAIEAIEHSIASNYAGIFEPRDNGRAGRSRHADSATYDPTSKPGKVEF